MIEKILDHEIEEILKQNQGNLTTLSEIIKKLESNRNNKGIPSVSKTTIYEKLEKMVSQKKIHHITRKGYKLLHYELAETDPNFKYLEIYKNLIDGLGFIWVTTSGTLKEKPDITDGFLGHINELEWEEFRINYKKLIEQGILEIKQYYPKEVPFLSISYNWALYHNICPTCLKKIEINKPHFVLGFLEEDAAYIEFVKTHINCIERILNRYELKKEYEGESIKYDPHEEFNLEEISDLWIDFTCPYCGLTLDIYDLFYDERGPLNDIYKKFQNKNRGNQILSYIQDLCKELYGDLSTLTWAKNITFKNVRLVIKKVVMIERTAYHPNCAIKTFEKGKIWDNLSNELNKEGLE